MLSNIYHTNLLSYDLYTLSVFTFALFWLCDLIRSNLDLQRIIIYYLKSNLLYLLQYTLPAGSAAT